MLAVPRVASASLSEREHLPDRRQSFVSASRIVVTRALTQASDFTAVLSAPPRARSVHFAVHHLPRRPLARGKAVQTLGSADLSTTLTPEFSRAVDGSPLTGLWLGLVVPKRYAKRAVTRTLLKRRIRAAVAASSATLASGLWVVRLRAPFARSEFISAASDRLDGAANSELAMLMAAAVARSPR
ncbi:MAG: ribonuclease P protein component [Burkholderiales bacterium]